MASPMPMASSGSWASHGQQQQHSQQYCPEPQAMIPMRNEPESPHTRLMGLKVSYTVDREAQVNYLARHPQPLLVQVVPLDDKNAIGIVDLRACVQCLADCSPELIGQDADYTVYAYDFSEPDQPLVGQGMLSWILDADFSQQKIVIGRVTKNMLAALAGGLKETLEVKFKLTPSPRISRPQPRPDFLRADSQMSLDMLQSQPRQQAQESVMTPTGVAEWNSFVQSNLQFGQPSNASRVASPAPLQNHAEFPNPVHHRHDSFSHQGPSSQIMPPQQPSQMDQQQQQQQQPSEAAQSQTTGQQADGPNRVAPTLIDMATDTANPPSRPSSRASTRSRKKQPTGRPRGRPRKKQPAEAQGSTSGYEDGTDGEEGPARKKRATTVQVSKNINAPFGGGGGPESLRVAASTSGSLRNMRPAGSAAEGPQGSHLQEVPRAPTPVPEGGSRQGPAGRPANPSNLRRQSTLSQASAAVDQPPFCELSFEMSPPSQDGRSPGESEAATPMYSEDSPTAIGSSPPVPRTTPFMRSSPPASSPILPPMPKPQPDSGFMSGDVEEVAEEVIKPLNLPPPTTVMAKPKRARNPPKFPVRVFDMQLEQVSSEAELVPFHHVQAPQRIMTQSLPPLQRSRSNTRNTMPPPPPESGKEPSPQPEEPAVASNMIVEEVAQTVSTEQAPSQPAETKGSPLEQELLAQLQAATQEDADVPEPAGQEVEEEVSLVEFDAPLVPTPGEQDMGHDVLSLALQRVPASDPVGPLVLPPLPLPHVTSFSEVLCPPSEALEGPRSPRSNKNYVKKESIRQRLQQAIESGEMPPYCHNCGAIETPTWRKIWVQEHEGVPETYEYSEKPGRVTAIIALDRDDDDNITKYQIIKKGLAPTEEKSDWLQLLLCNPCGIWLCKWKNHRPEDRWGKDQTRLANRRSRGRKTGPRPNNRSRSKKSSKAEPTPELNLQTDSLGFEGSFDSDFPMSQPNMDDVKAEARSREASLALELALRSEFNPGSTHSRGSGTARSPIALEMDDDTVKMGTTRRLLFPSPRKDGVPKALSDVSINLVQTPTRSQAHKAGEAEKENIPEYGEGLGDDDDLEALFRSPIARPSTPPPKEKGSSQGPFKTPTRPTPSHRPVTRSISRSIRSARSVRSSEQLAMLQRTPTRTPRSVARVLIAESPTLRRSPRLTRQDSILETPMTRSLNQLLSDAHDFDMDTNHMDLDLSNLHGLDDGAHELIDFGTLLSTDMAMPSSPPKGSRRLGLTFTSSATMWSQFSETGLDVDMDD